MPNFNHIMIGTDDVERARKFYDALSAVMGGKPAQTDWRGRLNYKLGDMIFIVGQPINGEPMSVSNGFTLGFRMENPEMCDAWHAAGVANGGISIEDPPGVRQRPVGDRYLAYLRDPDGNKLVAYLFKEE